MTRRLFALALAAVIVPLVLGQAVIRFVRAEAAAPALLRVSAANPHYLEYRGRPLLLISSAEHYGAVINQASTSSRTWPNCNAMVSTRRASGRASISRTQGLQHHEQHAGAGNGPVHRALGAQHPAGLRQRRQQVRSVPVG
jgi:hypothetical protein